MFAKQSSFDDRSISMEIRNAKVKVEIVRKEF